MFPQFIFIRHGESVHNQKTAAVASKFAPDAQWKKSPEYKQIKYSQQLIDGRMTKKGQQQALKAKQRLNMDHIDIVVVSPLQRALKTCDIIFGDQKNINIYVQPLMSQLFSSAVDIGGHLKQSRKTYGDRFKFDRIPVGSEERWYLDFILPQEKRKKIIQISQQQKLPYHLASIQFIKNNVGQTHLELQKRVKLFKQQLLKYKALSKKKIALVGHSLHFQYVTATGFHEDGSPINGAFLGNCQPTQIPIVLQGYQFQDQDLNAFCKVPF